MNANQRVVTSVALTENEREFLLELFASAENELLAEIANTDTRDFKNKLQDRLTFLETLRDKITGLVRRTGT
jgi:hypothetical protein